MEQSWRVLVLAAWLLILWTLETAMPLKKNDRSHVLINFFFTGTTILINAILIYVSLAITNLLAEFNAGLFHVVNLPVFVQLIIAVVVLDLFAAYLSHRVMHMHKLFWRFHHVHHLDDIVDVTTGLRQHPLEALHRFVFLVVGVAILGPQLYIIVIYQTISSLFALAEHANIKINSKTDRVLSFIFITPNFHKVHHSTNEKHSSSNFGNIFSLWDRIFGTYNYVDDLKDLNYGISGESRKKAIELLKLPMLESNEIDYD